MQSVTDPVADEPTPPYEDSIEGMLQYHADLSLYYAAESKNAKTGFKREYFLKKQRKNNEKMYRLLVRTPNQFNPLLEYIQGAISPSETEDGSVTIPFCQVIDENAPPYVEGTLTTSSDS